ncbi:hypothetical protein MFUL124B02_30900 [Myxococcus fulvus 124B02]|nr:hypothetical protein MFUL124B02_30900 [Myxococcus fulvus 124B02]
MAQEIGVLLPVRLETRFIPPKNGSGWLLRVLVSPDEVSIDRHDPIPADSELDSLELMWNRAKGDLDSEEGKSAWRMFAERVGGARAAWLARSFPQLPPGPDGVIHVARPATTRTEPRMSRIAGFPPRLELWAARGSAAPALLATSTVDAALLRLDFGNPNDPASARWWSDWGTAVSAGLGFEVDLGLAVPNDVRVLYVVGLGSEDPINVFGAHRDSGALAVIEPGTPTNSVDGAPAASLAREPETWRAIARAPDVAGAGSQSLSHALVGRGNVFGQLPGDSFNHRAPGQSLLTALWPALWGHGLKDVWNQGAQVVDVGLWASQHVVPEGPLPPIRIHDQPYGVLPTTSLRRWQVAPGDPALEEEQRPSLVQAMGQWAAAAEGLGTVAGADTDKLLKLLGRTPTSNGYAYRNFVSLDLLYLLYWSYDGGVSWSELVKWWEEESQAPRVFQDPPARRYATLGWPQDLRIPLVAPEDVSPETTLRAYLQANFTLFTPDELLSRPMRVLFDKMQPTPSKTLPDSLLVRLLWHALVVSAAEVRRARLGQSGPFLEPVQENANTPARLDAMARSMTSDDLTVGGSVVALYHQVREMAARLFSTPVGTLERVLRGTLDSAAFRLDPWVTAYAWRRLKSASAQTHAFHLGVYGWVDAPAPGTPGPTEGGLLHAPSEAQAVTAVVLRDKALNDAEPSRWNMNLDSNAVRLAEQVAEQVRLGAHIQEVLGREVERVAASKASVAALRMQFPIRAAHAGRRVCNGEAVLQADPSTLPLTAAQKAQLVPLRQVLDVYGDLLVAEAVHHVVSGRGDIAGAAMDAAAGLTAPPNLEVIQTRRTGRAVNTNVVMALPVAQDPQPAFDTSPGRVAEPSVAAFLVTRVGPANAAPWRWRVVLPDSSHQDIFLADMGLQPIDAVLLSEEQLAGLVLAHAPEGATLETSETAEGLLAMRRARGLIKLFGGRPALPEDLVDTGERPEDTQVRQELLTRYGRLRDVGGLLVASLQAAESAGDTLARKLALRDAARWGITPVPLVEDTLEEQVGRARAALVERLAHAPSMADAAPLSAAQLATAIAELAAPEGQLVVLSRLPLQGSPTTLSPAPTLDSSWLSVVSAVRTSLAHLEVHQLDALLEPGAAPLSAWTNRPSDPWQKDVPPGPDGRAPDTRLVALYGPAGVLDVTPQNPTGIVSVGLLDSWGETVPDVEQATTAAFGFNAPASRAPQAVLLAVSPLQSGALDSATLLDIVAETRELAHARMAAPAELHAFDSALPLMMLPASGGTLVELDPVS